MNLKTFLFIIMLLYFSHQASIPPTWTRDFKIDAGQVKAVNLMNGTSVNAGTSYSFLQPFVNASFTSIPRFTYAMNSYGLDASLLYNTTLIGYSINITQILTSYYNLTVTVIGIRMIALNYQYIAVEGYTNLYYISMDNTIYSRTFDNTTQVGNTAFGSTRTTVLQFQNPFSYTLNPYNNTNQLILRVWPVSFDYRPLSNVLSLKLEEAILNRTSFSVSVTVENNMVLQKLRISVLYVNKTAIYQNTYTQFIFRASQIHFGGNSTLTQNVYTDYGTVPFNFRNTIYGYRSWYIPFLNSTNNLFFFNANTTVNRNIIAHFQTFQQSSRACLNGTFTFFRVEDNLCHDSCPTTGYYFNTTFRFCNKCHPSCVNCTSNTDRSCTACNTTLLRILTNNSCPCMSNYADVNNVCTQCHQTCLNCTTANQNGCSSCLAGSNRQLNNESRCVCMNGYYSNITCMTCANSCATCSFNVSTSIYQCLSCAVNSSRIVINQSCVCDYGFFEQNGTCHACSVGCMSCTSSLSNACSSCNTSSFRALSNTSCPCLSNHTEVNTSCQPCHYTCLSCTSTLSTGCSSCSSSLNRQLISNSTCQCSLGFYQNTTCFACLNNCSQCRYHSANSSYQCMACHSNSSKIIINQTCLCIDGFFDLNGICTACHPGCLNCTQLATCLLCNTTALFNLSSSNVCTCPLGYRVNGSICQVIPASVCGNGLYEAGQFCDDGNLNNFDGCSSVCVVEPDHICINNTNISSQSICYYNKSIEFKILSVFKVPFSNTVEIIMSISADNINQVFLKMYLQTNISIELKDVPSRRLLLPLNSSDLVTAKTSYNIQTNQMSVQFQYDKSIDLSKKQIIFRPSSSISTDNKKYFFSSPTIVTQLITPTNKLPTIFYSSDQFSRFRLLNSFYLFLVIISWVFLLLAICFKQTAIIVESFLVIQIMYESMMKSQYINQGYSGLILFGKYLYGYNISYDRNLTFDKLQIIGLNSNIFSTLNLTFSIMLIVIVTICVMIFYETIRFKMQQSEAKQRKGNKRDRDEQMTNVEGQNEKNQKIYNFKRSIILILLQGSLAFSFITVKITTITLFNLKINENMLSFAICIALCIIYAIIWFIFYKFYNIELFRDISFKKIIRQPRQELQEGMSMTFSQKCIQFYVKYYYLVLFALLVGFGCISSIQISGIAVFLIIIMFSLGFVIFGLVNNTYYRKQNSIRVLINIITLIVLMILQIIQSKTINVLLEPTLVQPIIGLSLLYFSILFNTIIGVRIMYKKFRNSRKIKGRSPKRSTRRMKRQVSDQVRNQTLEPIQKIQVFEDIRFHKPIIQQQYKQKDIQDLNASQEQINKHGKYSRNEQRSQMSMIPDTHKKIAVQYQQNYQRTKQRFSSRRKNQPTYQKQVRVNYEQSSMDKKSIKDIQGEKYEYKQNNQSLKNQEKQKPFEQLQIIYVSESSESAKDDQQVNNIQNQLYVPPSSKRSEIIHIQRNLNADIINIEADLESIQTNSKGQKK